MREGELKILEAIQEKGPQGISFSELKNTTGLSSPSLSENLKRLVEGHVIIHDYSTKLYKPPGYVEQIIPMNKEKNEAWKKQLSSAVYQFGFWGHKIWNISQLQGREKEREEYLRNYLDYYGAFLFMFIIEIMTQSVDIRNQGVRTPEHIEEQADKSRKYLKEQVEAWMIPIFNSFSVGLSLNADLNVYNDYVDDIGATLLSIGKEWMQKIKKIEELLEL